jgi:DNA-binding response OmpR family regulator
VPGFVHPLSTSSTYRVLYVGDDLKFIKAFREAVNESVYRLVACADHGSVVLFLESDIHYDLMLIDHDWRGNEALQLARLSRSQRHRKHMPIVVLSSAKLDGQTKALAKTAGVIKCDLKSADMNKLVSRLIVAE